MLLDKITTFNLKVNCAVTKKKVETSTMALYRIKNKIKILLFTSELLHL